MLSGERGRQFIRTVWNEGRNEQPGGAYAKFSPYLSINKDQTPIMDSHGIYTKLKKDDAVVFPGVVPEKSALGSRLLAHLLKQRSIPVPQPAETLALFSNLFLLP